MSFETKEEESEFKKKVNYFKRWRPSPKFKQKSVVLKVRVNLRYKGLVKMCLNKNYIFLQSWELFFLRKACVVVEQVAEMRGLIFLFYTSSLDFTKLAQLRLPKSSYLFLLNMIPIPGFISNFKMYGVSGYVPELVIYLVDKFEFFYSVIDESFSLQIPLIAPIGGSVYNNIPYPVIIQKNIDRLVILFLKSILKGIFLEKQKFRNVKITKG